MSIIAKTDLKSFLKVSGTGQDDFFTSCCEWSQAIIESWCRRTFEETTYTSEKYQGDGTNILYLRHYPVTEVTAITIDDVAMASVGSDYVRTNLKTGAVYLKSGIFTKKDYQNVEISYKAGYAAAGMPKEIKYACIELASLIYKDADAGKGRLGIDSENITGPGGNRFIHKLNEMTLKGLSKHRRIVV